MTKQEFEELICDWDDLRLFCRNNGCSILDNIYSEEEKDSSFDDRLIELARRAGSWQELYNVLDDIPQGYAFYELNDYYGDFEGLDTDDFYRYKRMVSDYMSDIYFWDDEVDDEFFEIDELGLEEDILADDEQEYEVGDMSLVELFDACNSKLHMLTHTEKCDARVTTIEYAKMSDIKW